mmetsp:Transcript_60744/g.133488  ORF Transcript_60744/g.133488 Transcript_60744/m.133488 type:complete len:239 (+) Transcript_60744:784-1500(+)
MWARCLSWTCCACLAPSCSCVRSSTWRACFALAPWTSSLRACKPATSAAWWSHTACSSKSSVRRAQDEASVSSVRSRMDEASRSSASLSSEAALKRSSAAHSSCRTAAQSAASPRVLSSKCCISTWSAARCASSSCSSPAWRRRLLSRSASSPRKQPSSASKVSMCWKCASTSDCKSPLSALSSFSCLPCCCFTRRNWSPATSAFATASASSLRHCATWASLCRRLRSPFDRHRSTSP